MTLRFVSTRLERFFINSGHGYDAYEQGVRFVFKGPKLTDGTTLGWSYLLYLGGTYGAAFLVFFIYGWCYYRVFDPARLRPKPGLPTRPDD